MNRGTLYVVSAPSGVGKTSLVAALRERLPQLAVSVSHTTRPPRAAERNGIHYHFVTPEIFLAMIEDGAFLEHARVFDHYYGTASATVEEPLAAGRDVILEIDWQGAQQVRRRMPGCQSIFILPPSREVLETRLRGRGQDDDEVVRRRLAGAMDEIRHYDEFDYLVVNEDFADALADLMSILTANRLRLMPQRERLRGLIERLLA